MIDSSGRLNVESGPISSAGMTGFQPSSINKDIFNADDMFVLANDGSLKFDFNNSEELTKAIVLSEVLPRRRCPLGRFTKGR